jgi:hypothetical protein
VEHDKRAAAIKAERDEDARWEKQKEKLDAGVRRTRE